MRSALEAVVENRAEQRLTLRVPLGSARGIEKEVVVTYAARSDPMHFDDPWYIHWAPDGGGLYPEFDGELTIRADQDYPTSIIELTGSYVPPLGIVGAAFDAVAGSKIAAATARTLLKTIGDSMERGYAAEAAGKLSEGAPG